MCVGQTEGHSQIGVHTSGKPHRLSATVAHQRGTGGAYWHTDPCDHRHARTHDDTYDVQSILVLGLNLREAKNANEVIEIIHRALPHPTVLLVKQGRKALVSLAIPRKSLAEHGAMVVGYHVQTGWVDAYAPDTQALWEKLPYEAQPHGDLLAYVQGLGQNLALWNLREWIGDHARIVPSGMANIREPLIRLETLNAEISQLRALRRNPDTPLRESSRMRVQEHRLAQDAMALAERIQGALR